MVSLRSSKGNDHALIVQGIENTKSKEKQIVKEKNPKSEIEDKGLKLTNEYSMKKVKKGGHPSVIVAARDFILRIHFSRRIWTSCLNILRSTTLKF